MAEKSKQTGPFYEALAALAKERGVSKVALFCRAGVDKSPGQLGNLSCGWGKLSEEVYKLMVRTYPALRGVDAPVLSNSAAAERSRRGHENRKSKSSEVVALAKQVHKASRGTKEQDLIYRAIVTTVALRSDPVISNKVIAFHHACLDQGMSLAQATALLEARPQD